MALCQPILQAIAAKVEDGSPCCDWVGSDGAGHFVKMVHNGIEYGDMQLICEVYQIMRDRLGMKEDEMSQVFAEWNSGDLDSYLIEITRDILKFKDEDGRPLVRKSSIRRDKKGRGNGLASRLSTSGFPLTLIGESVFARCLSAAKSDRVAASRILGGPTEKAFKGDKKAFIADLGAALYAAKVVSYAQGFLLMKEAAKEYGWTLDFGSIALMWRGGCIIRSAFLGKIKEAFDADLKLGNLMMAPFFAKKLAADQDSWRSIVRRMRDFGNPRPCPLLRSLVL